MRGAGAGPELELSRRRGRAPGRRYTLRLPEIKALPPVGAVGQFADSTSFLGRYEFTRGAVGVVAPAPRPCQESQRSA